MLFDKVCTPNKTSRNSKLFYERKCKVYRCDHYETLSPLNNRINFTIVNCLMYFNLIHFRSKATFTISIYTKIKFSWTNDRDIHQTLFILKLEPDLDPKAEKLSEHRVWGSASKQTIANRLPVVSIIFTFSLTFFIYLKNLDNSRNIMHLWRVWGLNCMPNLNRITTRPILILIG